MFSKLLWSAAVAASALAFAQSAAAATVFVTKVDVTSNDASFDRLNLSTLGGGPDLNTAVWAPGILFTEETSIGGPTSIDLVFCVDLEHVIYVQDYATPLKFETGVLTHTGNDMNTVDPLTSNQIGNLAGFGRSIYAHRATISNYQQQLVAVQGAIWSLEYGVGPGRATSSVGAIDKQIADLIAIKPSGKGLASELLSDPHSAQNMVTGVPEPASWALMISGFGMAGAMLRRRQRAALAA